MMRQLNRKRLWSLVLALVMVLGLMAPQAMAAKTSGKCGKNATWSYNKKSRTLTISGTGTVKEADWPAYSKINLVIRKGITAIASSTFSDMDVRKLSLPSTLTTIGSYVFWDGQDGNLPATITIPKNVKKIGFGAFSGCTRLKNIKVEKGNKNYVSVDGVLYSKDKKLLLTFPAGKKGTYKILKGTRAFAPGSFCCVALKKLIVPASVKRFGSSAEDGDGISCDTTIKTLRFQGKPPKGLLNDLTDDDHGLEFDHLYYPKKYQKQWKKVEARYRSIMKNDLGYEDGDFTAWQSY